jgi:hypothetical protein
MLYGCNSLYRNVFNNEFAYRETVELETIVVGYLYAVFSGWNVVGQPAAIAYQILTASLLKVESFWAAPVYGKENLDHAFLY